MGQKGEYKKLTVFGYQSKLMQSSDKSKTVMDGHFYGCSYLTFCTLDAPFGSNRPV